MRRFAPFTILLSICLIACDRKHRFHLPTEPTRCSAGLAMTANVRGQVVTSGGQPIANAEVQLGGRTIIANTDGEFSFRELTSGTIPLIVRASGYYDANGQIQMMGGDNRLLVPLARNISGSGILFGRVLDSCTGRPIAGARVGTPDAFVFSASDGTYTLTCCYNTTF